MLHRATREAVRRRIVGLAVAFYWLLVLEGALRKWGLPQLEQALFFVRVPVALACYWLAFRHHRWPRTTQPVFFCYLLALVATLLVPLQLVTGGYGQRYVLIAGYGWLNYFFYIPLAFVIAEQFQANDIQRLTRHAAWLALASVPIVVLQFFSPPSSVINLGAGLDEANQFANLGAALGYVRPTGFFSSTAGQTQFLASTAALLMATLLLPRRARHINPLLLWAGMGAVAVMTAYSQSRGAFFMLGLALAATALGGIIASRKRVLLRGALLPGALVVMMAALWPLLFPEAFRIFAERWTGAMASESQLFELGVFGRAFYGFYGFIHHLGDTPLFGYLLGLGGNAANQLDWVQFPAAAYQWQGHGAWAEDGWSRHIIELGPVFGLAFIGLRLYLTLWLARHAVRAARRSGDVTAIILFGFVGIVLLQGQITGHGTINGFAWLFAGLCIAAARTACTPYGRLSALHRSAQEQPIDVAGYVAGYDTNAGVPRQGYR